MPIKCFVLSEQSKICLKVNARDIYSGEVKQIIDLSMKPLPNSEALKLMTNILDKKDKKAFLQDTTVQLLSGNYTLEAMVTNEKGNVLFKGAGRISVIK